MARKFLILTIAILLPSICYGLTLSELLTRERLRIRETDSTISYYTNANLRALTNDAIQFISGYGIGVVQTDKITGVADVYDYDLPSDYINWLSVIIPNYQDTLNTLVYVEPEYFGKSFTGSKDQAEVPKEFTVYGDTILSVSPPYSYGGDTIYLKYIATPAALDTATDTCDLNYVYQLLIIDYIWAEYQAKEGNVELYNAIMDGILNRLEKYKQGVNLRQSQPAQVEGIKQ